MTNQTKLQNRLGVSPAGSVLRSCVLTLVAALTGAATLGFAQTAPDAVKPAQPVADKKPAPETAEKHIGGYLVHQDIELGGRIVANKTGSDAMWATMINQGTGMRMLSHSLEMHSLNPSKTPFFDTLSSESFGYGGDPNDVSYLKFSKGRWYNFSSSFRRDRNYFDYNLLANSLLSTANAANPVLVPEPDSLHLFNTVRRNTDTTLTLLPLSFISFRAGFNHGTNEGPTYSSVHEGGDVQVLQWFRNSLDTWVGGVDVKLARRTTVSYDQFYGFYKGDSTFHLTGANFLEADGVTPGSLGVDTLATATCGSGANKTAEVVNGVINPFCSQTSVQSQVAPTRTSFPTEQVRFASRYWDRISMNGRATYSGDISNVNNFNETFTGLLTRTFLRQEIDTGGLGNGQFAHNKRINVNADYGIEAELNKYVSISDAISFWDFRIPGNNAVTSEVWADTGTPPPVPTASLSVLTPLSALTPVTTTTPNSGYLGQRNLGNTLIGSVVVTPQVKLSGGWRINDRQITKDTDPALEWHQNWLLLGGVIQPSHALRINLNYDQMSSKSTDLNATPSDTYTREAPNKIYHFRARATVLPAKWINFAVTANDYSAKNDDPLVNHTEHNHDFSFATEIVPLPTLSLNFNYAYDDVFSQTDICYIFVPTATVPLPPGAAGSTATCLQTADNPQGTLPTQTASTQLYLGTGLYNAPSNFFMGSINFAPSKYFKFNGGARINSTNGHAEFLNPLMVPGALQSKVVSPFADLQIYVARQWAWHGNWEHHGYDEAGGAGPAPRSFHGDVVTLGVKYAF
jgi:hypothetical protein